MVGLTVGLYLLTLLIKATESTLVKVEQGWLRGEIKTTSTNMGQYYSFKGIPYAAPPLGKLRFKAPQPHPNWNGIRNATEHCSICMQQTSFSNRTAIGSEDCLCLNIYTPDLNPDSLKPVMFYIHGGIFIIGSGNSDKYSPDFLIPHDVVIVTSNYRLGVLGFLAIDTQEVPGNAAMKDNIAALQWIKDNIMEFGGNPDCVTLFGDSSGAAMVSLHILTPYAKNLFKRAILMSGTILTDRSLEFQPRRRAFALGRVLGLNTDDPYKLTSFLQSVPAKNLIKSRPNILTSDEIYNDLQIISYFTPHVEKKFGNGSGQYLTTQPFECVSKERINPVDIMIGQTACEGSKATARLEDKILNYYPKYKELLVPFKISYFRDPAVVMEIADSVHKFYFNNQTISKNNIIEFVKFNTYFRYNFDFFIYIEKLSKLPSVRWYFYKFALYSSRNFFSKEAARKYRLEEATHQDDVPYLFSFNQTVDVKSKEFEYIQLMCKLFTNFAKYGNPTPDMSLGLKWPEYYPGRRIMVIGRNGTDTKSSLSNDPDLNFWLDLYERAGINL